MVNIASEYLHDIEEREGRAPTIEEGNEAARMLREQARAKGANLPPDADLEGTRGDPYEKVGGRVSEWGEQVLATRMRPSPDMVVDQGGIRHGNFFLRSFEIVPPMLLRISCKIKTIAVQIITQSRLHELIFGTFFVSHLNLCRVLFSFTTPLLVAIHPAC